MKSTSKDRQGGHGDQLLDRFHRAKSSISGAWRCRGGDYISPSPRGSLRKKEKSEEKGENKKILEDPLFMKLSQPPPVKSDRLSLEGLALEYQREGNSKRKGKGGPAPGDKSNRQLQPPSQPHQNDFNPWGDKAGNLESDAASKQVGPNSSGKGKEKADTESDTDHFELYPLQDARHEIVEVNASSSIHSPSEKDSQPTDLLKTGSSKHADIGQSTMAVTAQGGFENWYRPPADFQRAFSSNSDIEEIGELSNTLKQDSETRRGEEVRKADDIEVDGVPEQKVQFGIEPCERPSDHQSTEFEESSTAGKAGQNLVIPSSESGYHLQDEEGEKVKAPEQHESPVSVLSGALGSGRWADFDSANNSIHPRAATEREIGEFESRSHDHLATNSHATGKDAIEGMGSRSGDYTAVVSEVAETEYKTEPNPSLHDIPGKETDSGDFKPENSEGLEQAGKDGTERSIQNLSEESFQEEVDPMVQKRKQLDQVDSTIPSDGRENPSEGEVQSSDCLEEVDGEKLQDGLHEKQVADGGPEASHSKNSPKAEGFGELLTGDGNSETPANGVHHVGTLDSYIDEKGVAGSTKLYDITAAGKDDRASIYGAAGPYLRYCVVGVAIVISVSYLHYRRILW